MQDERSILPKKTEIFFPIPLKMAKIKKKIVGFLEELGTLQFSFEIVRPNSDSS